MLRVLVLFIISASILICHHSWGESATPGKEKGQDPWLGRDKVSHLVLSLSVVGLSYHLARMEGEIGRCRARTAAFGTSLTLGLAKECYDRKRSDSGFSYRDLVYDLVGSGLGLLIFTQNR